MNLHVIEPTSVKCEGKDAKIIAIVSYLDNCPSGQQPSFISINILDSGEIVKQEIKWSR